VRMSSANAVGAVRAREIFANGSALIGARRFRHVDTGRQRPAHEGSDIHPCPSPARPSRALKGRAPKTRHTCDQRNGCDTCIICTRSRSAS
jgi:hypothetical protein